MPLLHEGFHFSCLAALGQFSNTEAFCAGVIFAAGIGILLEHLRMRKKYVAFAQRIEGSPFEFVKIAATAREMIFAIGPNLNYLTQDKVRDLLFTKLSSQRF